MADIKSGASQEGRTNAKSISETPRNQEKGTPKGSGRGYEGPISFTTKKPRE
jgi:hypothetical protein